LTRVVANPPALGAAPVGTGPESVAIDPLGRFLYVANSGDGTVSGFTINASGQLTSVGAATATGGGSSTTTTAVTVDISGQYLYVANGDAGTVSTFTIDQSSGVLNAVGSPISTLIFSGEGGPSAIAAQ
jgi:DNA-binding beta-propeller fold protein YncE